MLADIKELLKQADAEKFAVPHFNYSDEWELYGILAAAEELRSPVVVSTNAQVSDTHGIRELGELGRVWTERSSVPVVHHLDHCVDREKCKLAIDSGYPSVMIDGSWLPLEENMAWTAEIVDYAKPRGAAVEAEVGRIRGNNAEGVYIGEDYLVDVDAAVKMAKCADIVSLAVGIGNAHGFYTEKPELNFQRLREVNEAVDVPLVLHGGTGIPEEDIRKAIINGINKVNIGTQIHYTYLQALREELRKDPESTNIVSVMQPVVERVSNVVKKYILMCMSQGRA